MRLALVCALGALHTCLAFRPKARPAWEGVAIVEQGISVEPSPACLEEMGRSHLIGGVFEKLKLGVACVIVCSSHKADPLTVQFDRAVRELRRLTGEDIPSTRGLVVGLDSSGITAKVETAFDVARDGARRFCWLSRELHGAARRMRD